MRHIIRTTEGVQYKSATLSEQLGGTVQMRYIRHTNEGGTDTLDLQMRHIRHTNEGVQYKWDTWDTNSKIFMNPTLCHAGSRIHKISSTLSKVIGDEGGGRGALCFCLLFYLNYVSRLILASTTICFAAVLLQSCTPCVAYNLYAIIKVVLLNV